MNREPVCYRQNDPRWAKRPYRAAGENTTIGSSGCGPTCAAMLIETLTGRPFTPEDACSWSMAHGYKARGHGTAYAYFKPQFAAFGLQCDQLNWYKSYHKPQHPNHRRALELLEEGYYLIALMGPGRWTTGGHFVVLWQAGEKLRVHDPYSAKAFLNNPDPESFFNEVCYYWWLDARFYNRPQEKEETDMTREEIRALAEEAAAQAAQALRGELEDKLEETARALREELAPVTYHTLEEVPAWGRETAARLVAQGRLLGDGTGDLCLTQGLLRALVIQERKGAEV